MGHRYSALLLCFLVYPAVFIGAALVLICIGHWVIARQSRRTSEQGLVIAIFTMLISGLAQATATSMSRLRPLKYDLFAYRIDTVFGQPSFVLGRFVEHHVWLECLLQVAYGILPNVVAVVLLGYVRESAQKLRFILYSFGMNLLVAPFFTC